MTDRDKSGQAREALIDSVKGKAKEIAGAVTGNDSLTAEASFSRRRPRSAERPAAPRLRPRPKPRGPKSLANEARIQGAEQRIASTPKPRRRRTPLAASGWIRSSPRSGRQARCRSRADASRGRDATRDDSGEAEERAEIDSAADRNTQRRSTSIGTPSTKRCRRRPKPIACDLRRNRRRRRCRDRRTTQELAMKITDIPFAALRLQYRIARAPLQLIEQRVIARMDSEAPGGCSTSVQSARSTQWSAPCCATRRRVRGAAQVERSQALGEAARLDAAAAQQRREADDELRRKREEAAAAPGRPARSQEKVQKARATAEQRKQQKPRKRRGGRPRSKSGSMSLPPPRSTQAESARRAEQQRITVAEKIGGRAADAATRRCCRQAARALDKRAHADRVEELVDEEKQQRKAARNQ